MKPNVPVRAVIFDLGGVLIEIDLQRTVDAWAASTGLTAEEVIRRLDGEPLSADYERGAISTEVMYQRVRDRIAAGLSREDFESGFNALLGPVLPGVPELLERLPDDLRKIALTNTNELHTRAWWPTFAPVEPHFERVFLSQEMGVRKPEPESFRRVLGYLDLPPEEVLFLDDTAGNVRAAAALGMVARRVTGVDETAAVFAELGVELS